MEEPRIVDERFRTRTGREQRELDVLVPGVVVLDQDLPRSGDESAFDRVRKVGELLELAGEARSEELHRAGEVAAEKNRAALDVHRRRRAELEQRTQVDGVGYGSHVSGKRRRPESNRCTRLCRPLPNHSATAPFSAPW
jgi:hypothetical protein